MSPAVTFRGIQPQHCQGTPPVRRAPLRGQKGPHPPEGSRPWDEGLIRLVPPPASQGALWPSCPGAFLRGVVSASPRSVSSSWPPPEASLSCLLWPPPPFPFHPIPLPWSELSDYHRFSISTLLFPATHSIHVQSCII